MSKIWDKLPELMGLRYEPHLTHQGKNRPLYLRIETVNTCNNYCIICAYRDQTREKHIMSMEMFEKTVQDYAALGGGFVSLTPLVGDVLLDRFLPERLRYLRAHPAIHEIGVTTNGAMAHRFDDQALTEIVRSFNRLSLSVYGIDPQEYEAMTKRPTYDKMVEGLRRIILAAETPVSLEFRLLTKRDNLDLLLWVCREVLPGMSAAAVSDKIVINSVITDYANWGIYDQQNTPLPNDAKWFASERQEHRQQCLIPMFACMVFSDGNVSFCPCDNFDDAEELRIGNIATHSLADIYNSPRVAELWNWHQHGTPEFCKNCSFHIPLKKVAENPTILEDPYQIVGSG